LFVRDHELAEIAKMADRRILKAQQSLEKAFDRIRPILYGRSPSHLPAEARPLPAELIARVMAMPEPEQRIRAIIECRMSERNRSTGTQEKI